MEFRYSTTWNSSIPLHGIQVFHYTEFKYSTTWNLNWLNGFENSTIWNWLFHLLQINGFDRLSVSGFTFHSYSWIYFKIWNWNHGFIFHYSHALPLFNSYLALFWSIQILFATLTHHKNLRSHGKNEQRNREENQQSLQKPSRTLLSNKPFNAGVNLASYHPPRHRGVFAPKGMLSPMAFAQQKMPGGGRVNKWRCPWGRVFASTGFQTWKLLTQSFGLKNLSCLSALLGVAKSRRLYQTAYLQIKASILLQSSSLRVF